MSDDDIRRRVVEGDPYERAEVTVRRTFPISLDRKVHLAIATLAAAVPLAPAVLLRRDLIGSLEGAEAAAGTLSLQLGWLALIGIAMGFVIGGLLVRQKRVLRRRSLSDEDARKLVRIEDFLTFFLIHATALVVVPTTLAVVGVVSPGTIETLYGHDVAVYQPTAAFHLDARLVSGIAGTLAVVLAALDRTVGAGETPDR